MAATVFDALQQGDGLWTKDDANNPGSDGRHGYNWKYTVPATHFAVSGNRFRCDVKFTPTSGEVFTVPFEFKTLKVYT